ncbi:MAG: DUF58 domain-containing protein [Gammaproteobacteria bacterium]|jgi:uncharacterized protein (DUF58 family)|nr:DUF58 domain-containing protein [Gammaproteobacteria bacterium]
MRAGALKAAPAALVAEEEFERLRLIALHGRLRRQAADTLTGVSPGQHRGEGLDLLESRTYQPGDDPRHMDWRATARSGRPMSKVFIADRRRDLFLLIDRRPSMMFGTRRELKAATAARIAALLAFRTLASQGAVSGMVLAQRSAHFPAAGTLPGILPLLRAAAAPPAWEPGADVRRPEPPAGAAMVLISDFHDLLDGAASLADYLPASGRPPVTAIRIIDDAERELPAAGLLRLVAPNGGKPVLVDTDDAGLRRRYAAAAAERDARFTHQCAALGIGALTVSNCRDLLPQIASML